MTRIALNAAGHLIQFSDPPQPRPLSWGIRADLAILAERARRPEREKRARAFAASVAKIVALAAAPLDIEPPSHDDGLPAGWPPDWPTTEPAAPLIDRPDKQRPWEKSPRDAQRRTVARREKQKQLLELTADASGRIVASPVSLTSAPFPKYAGGRGWARVDLARRLVLKASGKRLPGVKVAEDGSLSRVTLQ